MNGNHENSSTLPGSNGHVSVLGQERPEKKRTVDQQQGLEHAETSVRPRSPMAVERIEDEKRIYAQSQKDREDSGEVMLSHGDYWKARATKVQNAKNLNELADALLETPHMNEMACEVREAADGLVPKADKADTVEGLTDIERGIYMQLDKEQQGRYVLEVRKTRTLEMQNRTLEMQNRTLEMTLEMKANAVKKLDEIKNAAVETEISLLALSALSQAEGTVAPDTETANKRFKWNTYKKELVAQMLEGEQSFPLPSSISEKYNHIVKEDVLPPDSFDRNSLSELDAGPRVARVSKVFQKAFRTNSTFPDRKQQERDKQYKGKIQQTVNQLRSLFKSAIENEGGGEVTGSLFFPGPTSKEVDGVQPIITVLLEALGDCCQLSFVEASQNGGEAADLPILRKSPPKIGVSEQMELAGDGQRPDRRCDIAIWKRGRCVVVMIDGFRQLTFEIKPGQRTDKSILELRREGKDQCLGHSSKLLLHCLRFAGGAGVPSHATSVLGSLTHIEVIQLRLVDPGKSSSHVELLSSGPLPLLEEDCFEKWYGSDIRERYAPAVADMKERLYANDHRGLDKDGVPLGIKAICALMMSPHQKLIGPEWDEVSTELGDLLGTGTFGMVFRLAKPSDVAVKVSKSGLRYFIKREAAVLNLLSNNQDRPKSVPTFISSALLNVKIGGVDLKLPAFAMKPVGQEIYASLSKRLDDCSSFIEGVLNDIMSALNFIHENGIAHNDVNDRNILLVPTGDTQWRAILVDFSIACGMYQRQRGFHGTPQFVHREVHKHSDWVPVPEYDKTSLGLSVVVLLERGVIPWKGLNDKGPKEDPEDSIYKERLELARACVLAAQNNSCNALGKEVGDRIEELLLLDEQEFQCACDCKITKCRRANCGCKLKGRSCTVLCKCYNKVGKLFVCERGSVSREPPLQLELLEKHEFDEGGLLENRP